jgi:hypothetical protein
MRVVSHGVSRFGRFWWEFLVGDTPELFLAALVVVAAAILLRHHRWAAIIVLPLLAAGALAVSVRRGRRKPPSGPGP